MKHTKGEWKAERTNVIVKDIKFIQNMPMGTMQKRRDEAHANAKLIAAAPDMLEALKVVLDTIIVPSKQIVSANDERFILIQEAIKKAE